MKYSSVLILWVRLSGSIDAIVNDALCLQMVIYDKPYFSGRSRTITTNIRDFMTRTDMQQMAFMYNVGSLKVLGGM